MNTKKQFRLLVLSLALIISACGETKKETETTQQSKETEEVAKAPIYNTEDPSSILASIEYAHGGWNDLWSKKDVQYTYDYRLPDDKADVSMERYIFDTEASFAHYTQHDVNAMPGAEGDMMQYFDGETTIAMLGDKKVEDPQAVGTSEFLRRANYFWFVMPYKLNDAGTIAKYMGQEDYNGTMYDKVGITYDSEITGKEQNDIYILYVNPETKMIDRFFFSLPALGVNVPAIIANYEYEDVEGQKIATKRTYFMPNENGEYGEIPSINQTLTNISFNNGFTPENIMSVE
ncbi:DUF6503 family protein [Winogradskyella immobilis]|uniref:Lipoprotein n=1 Tax=Winogradskyella immobilis TaxID=2816852 RepID=A0ABS8EKS5_9FLAO|nr:DUF6503 family protein [Winogradskyella immobilis]MCC1483690.1 hypothetical protein [Winogradskyella immobilis]MCG0015784.1 hypothetical protein [Winogradskyella immobilis]